MSRIKANQRQKWIDVIHSISTRSLGDEFAVLELHFKSDDFVPKEGKKILEDNAVPTIDTESHTKMAESNSFDETCRSCSSQSDELFTLNEAIRTQSGSQTAAQLLSEYGNVKVY